MDKQYLVTWQRTNGSVLYWTLSNEHGEGWTPDREYATSMNKSTALEVIDDLERSNLPSPYFIEVPL